LKSRLKVSPSKTLGLFGRGRGYLLTSAEESASDYPAPKIRHAEKKMLIILIVLILVFGFGGYRLGPGLGYYGGGGISLILLIVLILLLLKVI